jgi:hypothetical protein
MRFASICRDGLVWACSLLCVAGTSFAQEPAAAPPAEEEQEPEGRPTGLPSGMDWTFNFDAGFGSFSFLNSLFTNPRDEPSGDLSDNWQEGFIKPSLSAAYTLESGAVIYGTASAVGERTYGGAPGLIGNDFSSFAPEDLAIGWRSGSALALGGDALEFTLGRARYQLGNGFLLYDGAGEGGSRGGYWSNARKAFEFAAIARFKPGPHTAEVFYLDKDELPEAETASRLWGTNYEFRVGDASTFGATYMKWFADAVIDPGRDGLNVLNLRAYTAPIPAHQALSLEFEYAREHNGEALTSNAWSLLGAYELGERRWTPKLSYRYAFFQGDDPATVTNEAFDPLFLGFSDWGTWWQGEIAGEYFLSNSNLTSHQVRVHVVPTEKLEGGLIVYRFRADHPAAYGDGVTSSDIAVEVDAYADWKLNQNFTLSLVGAFANPGEAVRQSSGRTANFGLGLLYFAYSF